MRKIWYQILLGLFLLPGCGTLLSLDSDFKSHSFHLQPYGGIQADCHYLTRPNSSPDNQVIMCDLLLTLDLPFSLAYDTTLLPITLTAFFLEKEKK